jgi:nucleotide-binding universal stress UspA family protein
MLKRILVPLDSSELTPRAMVLAIEIAKGVEREGREPVTLVGLSVADTDQIPAGRFASMVRREDLLEEARNKAEGLTTHFRQIAVAQGIPEARVETRSVAGSPFREIIQEGVFCDVIVMAPRCSFPPVHHDYDTMAQLYHHSSRPIVISGRTEKPVEKVVMAMNGTAPASRMMYAYAHLNPFPKAKVTVAYSREEEEQYGLSGFFKSVEAYLKTYHQDVKMVGVSGPFAREVAGVVTDEDAQMLAMGIPAEQFMGRFLESIRLLEYPAQRLLEETPAGLFTVH